MTSTAGTTIVLPADELGQPALELSRLRYLSDLERMSRPGPQKDRLRRRIMQYVPAVLDELEQMQALRRGDRGAAGSADGTA